MILRCINRRLKDTKARRRNDDIKLYKQKVEGY